MNNYKLTIQYDGGRYKGWQRLGDDDNTIQGKLEKVLSQLLEKETEIIGCSRTDAGVHALGQVANFKTDMELAVEYVKEYFNRYLPKDICITEAVLEGVSFHSRYNAKDKTYLYRIWNKEYSNPFARKYSMHIPEKLDIYVMKEASRYFLGEHDFTAFSNAKSKKKSMVREIYTLELTEEKGFIEIRIKGNGFLYNMVRWVVGTLVEVGLGRIKPVEIPNIIAGKDRSATGNMAEACGLYLEKITYEIKIDD